MSRQEIDLEQMRGKANRDASLLVSSVLRLCDEVERVTQERDDARRELRNLLAVIHRDNGTHTYERGLPQSIDDAYTVWGQLVVNQEAAQKEVEHLRRGIDAYRSDYGDMSDRCRGSGCACRVHEWERKDEKARERMVCTVCEKEERRDG